MTEAAHVSVLEREVARIAGEIGAMEASIAEAGCAIAGDGLERLSRIAIFREEAQAALREIQPQIAKQREQMHVIEQRRERLVLRAPMAGPVLERTAHMVGGAISPGAVIASILSESIGRIVREQIDPAMIDRVAKGQSARVRFPLMGAMQTPETEGEVRHVSGDGVVDQDTGRRLFTAEIVLAEIPGFAPKHGQPAEVFLRTDTRSPASFLLKPAADYFTYAMRER